MEATAANKLIAAVARLFELPYAAKERYAVDKRLDPLASGFSPYGVATALDTGVPNLLETWDVSPTGQNWPVAFQAELKTITGFEATLRKLARQLVRSLSRALGGSPNDLFEIAEPMRAGLHLIHYFRVPENGHPAACRQSKHTDNTLFTLLPVPSPRTSGVHVLDREDGRWHEVTIDATDCVLQSGRLLEFLTGGAVPACLHTVATPSADSADNVSRFATPFFVSPPRDGVLSVLPRFRPPGQSAIPTLRVDDAEAAYFGRIFGKGQAP